MKLIKISLILIYISTLTYAKSKCEFPPQWNIKDFSFEKYGYTPPKYVLEEDSFGFKSNSVLGNIVIRNSVENSDFPFETLNIIAGCGNTDAMVAISKLYDNKSIKKYWLKRAIKLNNIDALREYAVLVKMKSKEFHEKNISILEKNYNNTKLNKYIRDMALARLQYAFTYNKSNIRDSKNIILKDLKFPTLSIDFLSDSYRDNYIGSIDKELSVDYLNFLLKMSLAKSAKASEILVEYYSTRDYEKTLKYLQRYKLNKQFEQKEIFPQYNSQTDKVYVYTKESWLTYIWKQLDSRQKELSIKPTKLEKKIKNIKIKKFNKNKKEYLKILNQLFPHKNIDDISLLNNNKKIKLLTLKYKKLTTNQIEFLYGIIDSNINTYNKEYIRKNTISKNYILKHRLKKLSKSMQQVVYIMASQIESSQTDNSKFTKALRAIVVKTINQSAYLEFGAKGGSKSSLYKVLSVWKKKYNLKHTNTVDNLAKKISLFVFAKDYQLEIYNLFTSNEEKLKKLKKATLYWLEYLVANIEDKEYGKNFKYYKDACNRLAQAYDVNLKDKNLNLGNNYNQERIYTYLNKIALRSEYEAPFSNYITNNNLQYNFKLFLIKAIELSKSNNKYLSNYFTYWGSNKEYDNIIEELTKNMKVDKTTNIIKYNKILKKEVQLLLKHYNKKAITSIDWYIKYVILKDSIIFTNKSKIQLAGKVSEIDKLKDSFIMHETKNKKRLLKKYYNNSIKYNNIRLKSNFIIKSDKLISFINKDIEGLRTTHSLLAWDHIIKVLKSLDIK